MNIIHILGIVLVLYSHPTEILGQYTACQDEEAVITCFLRSRINIISVTWEPATNERCIGLLPSPTNKECTVNVTKKVQEKCNGLLDCSVFGTTELFGDPCPGTRYQLVHLYQCPQEPTTTTLLPPNPGNNRPYPVGPWYPGWPWGPPEKPESTDDSEECDDVQTAVTCYPDDLRIKCSKGARVQILNVFYGRDSGNVCNSRVNRKLLSQRCDESNWAKKVVNYECQGRSECVVRSKKAAFWDKCVHSSGYLRVSYICR